jgi:hypothetical protein
VSARIVGVIRRFPSTTGEAIIADRTAASTALDTRFPGLGQTNELWVNVPSGDTEQAAAALGRAPFSTLAVTSRAATLASLRSDPLARGSLITLAGTAIVALALALLGLLLAVVGDLRDDRGELFDLEAQGAAPSAIRAHLRLRATLLTVFGVAGGVALGAILSALVVSLVAVTAGAAAPQPPLRLAASPWVLTGVGVIYLAVAALAVGAATHLPGRAPSRAAEAAA